ncbi:unnamed protein product [Eruca vesicaria subsp. sativa]|uniref:Uncharacterized protein n=1 Tax=Eruca vesicaria subsp. sativa TaxID=29727 RepID=A0ABC8J2N5_ERUVS|nr:unnamed protein product [Eruca vesicaria subsp. sativa]
MAHRRISSAEKGKGGIYRRTSQARERSNYGEQRYARPPRDSSRQQELPAPPSRSYYRETNKILPEAKDTGSSASKNVYESPNGGNPLDPRLNQLPQKAVNEALGEVKKAMLQYTKSANPTEREAREERSRQSEEEGDFEETAIQMVRSSLGTSVERQKGDNRGGTPERVPEPQRLGPNPLSQGIVFGRVSTEAIPNSQERVPATLRLGPPTSPQPNLRSSGSGEGDEPPLSPALQARVPASLRLQSGTEILNSEETLGDTSNGKKKRGHPPGSRTVQDSTKVTQGEGSRRRRVVPNKPSPLRKKVNARRKASTAANDTTASLKMVMRLVSGVKSTAGGGSLHIVGREVSYKF